VHRYVVVLSLPCVDKRHIIILHNISMHAVNLNQLQTWKQERELP
jgi:hypothetical protein